MVFESGGKRHSLNDVTVKAMSYEQLEEVFEGKLDWKIIAKEFGIKPTPKKKKPVRESKD